MFERLGAKVFDADRTVHELMEPGTPVWRKIRAEFGAAVLREDGGIDRKRLGQAVFGSGKRLKTLNRIIHPAVRRSILGGLRKLRREKPGSVAVLDIPLLLESGGAYRTDVLVVVTAPQKAAAGRLKKRSGWSEAEMKRRAAFQMPLKEKRKKADFVVKNSGTLPQTRRQVLRIWKQITGEKDSNGRR